VNYFLNAVLVADGELLKPEKVKVVVTENAFNFSGNEDIAATGNPNDRVIILLYNKNSGRVYANYSGAQRDELSHAFPMKPGYIKNNTYKVFIAFKDIMSDEVPKACIAVDLQIKLAFKA
jgi:hypothetical protein